mgnify:CR=1 FL=1
MGLFSRFLTQIKVSDLLYKPDLEELTNELIAADLGQDLSNKIIVLTQ